MRMQESLVSVNEGGGRLCLSGTLSEWLFSSKFWSDFNAQHGTMFDQFEEDDADIQIIEAIIGALNDRMSDLERLDEYDIEFAYRWTSDNKPLTASASRNLLLSELAAFRDFLVNAAAKNCSVTLSL